MFQERFLLAFILRIGRNKGKKNCSRFKAWSRMNWSWCGCQVSKNAHVTSFFNSRVFTFHILKYNEIQRTCFKSFLGHVISTVFVMFSSHEEPSFFNDKLIITFETFKIRDRLNMFHHTKVLIFCSCFGGQASGFAKEVADQARASTARFGGANTVTFETVRCGTWLYNGFLRGSDISSMLSSYLGFGGISMLKTWRITCSRHFHMQTLRKCPSWDLSLPG